MSEDDARPGNGGPSTKLEWPFQTTGGAPRVGERIIAAFNEVDRLPFLPGVSFHEAQLDRAFLVRSDSDSRITSSTTAPVLMASMLGALDVGPGANVLEIGSGTGYNAAILSRVVRPGGTVTSVEVVPEMAETAQRNLSAGGADEVSVVVGDGWQGCAERQPYDGIIATTGCWALSPHWFDQLKPGGRLVCPLWLGPCFEAICLFRRTPGGGSGRLLDSCHFAKARGRLSGPPIVVEVRDASAEVASAIGARRHHVDLFKEIVTSQPTYMDARVMPGAWFRRVALEDDGAFCMQRGSHLQGYFLVHGVFDPDSRSAAWLERDLQIPNETQSYGVVRRLRLAAVGGLAALARLRAYMENPVVLELEDFEIRCGFSQDDAPAAESPHWILGRGDSEWRLWNNAWKER